MKLEAPTNPDVIEALNLPANAPFIQLVIPPPTWWQENREWIITVFLLLVIAVWILSARSEQTEEDYNSRYELVH